MRGWEILKCQKEFKEPYKKWDNQQPHVTCRAARAAAKTAPVELVPGGLRNEEERTQNGHITWHGQCRGERLRARGEEGVSGGG